MAAPSSPIARYSEQVRRLYGTDYARAYPDLYRLPWPDKHRRNLELLEGLLRRAGPAPRWLDLACGQAWHFAHFAGRARMTGIDLSPAQLARARQAVPEATLLCGDMAEASFAPQAFDLVTNFWGGYCYLASRAAIAAFWRRTLGWIAPGGALYVELLLAEDLAGFNRSEFARRTGFAVMPRGDSFVEWAYRDSAGEHRMTSPPLAETLDILAPAFASVDVRHDGMFMTHVVAEGRRRDR